MGKLDLYVQLGGVLHLSLLVAGWLVPRTLDLKASLAHAGTLLRQMVWVHGVFIVFVVLGFSVVSMFQPGELMGGSALGRSVCGFIALFWFSRLLVQLFLFDARPHLTNPLLKWGYHGLTGVFCYLSVVYAAAALAA